MVGMVAAVLAVIAIAFVVAVLPVSSSPPGNNDMDSLPGGTPWGSTF